MKRIQNLRLPGKSYFVPMIFALSCILSCSTDKNPDSILIGNWIGPINDEVHVFYEFSRKWDGSLIGYNGIVEFKLSGGPVEVVSLNQDTVLLREIESNQRYVGVLNRDSLTIRGSYTNLNIGSSWPLNLHKVDSLPLPPRPQTPKKPYPYIEEDVVYENESAGIHIAGTLTMPAKKGPSPAVLLITGSGQQNRDEEFAFHHPFLVLADYLTRNGIAVLRVDDRGVGGTTRTGPFFNSTTKDLAGDALAGIRYLKSRKEVDPEKIGLIGHSEGGLIAAMLAAESPDIAFIVLMASPAGGNFGAGIIKQDSTEARARGADDHETSVIMNWCKRYYDIVINENNKDTARKKMQRLFDHRTKEEKEAFKKTGLSGGTLDIDYALTPHFQYLLSLNPDDFLKQTQCPVLALMGDKDASGPSKSILKAIENALVKDGNKNYKIQELENLNHHFQTVRNDDSEDIEETISPVVLEIVASWITEQTHVQ
jgi:pimeloyl-ACP methyl ester carboxylesterase